MAEKIALLRKQRGWSQEELAEKIDVSRQSVSKWESGGSIPDLERVISLAELFGVSTDYLLLESETEESLAKAGGSAESGAKRWVVSAEEADAFMTSARRTGQGIALGAALFIASPALLLILLAVSELRSTVLSERAAIGTGVAALLVFVAAGVALCVVNGLSAGRYDYMEKERLELSYGVYGIVQNRKEHFAPRYRMCITLGVVGIILSVLPLVIAGVTEASEAADILWTAFLLLCVAVAVYFIVSAATVNDSFDKLLEKGSFSLENKAIRRRIRAFPGIYWSIVTGAYLALLFLISDLNNISWIIWPVAGVLYPAALAIVRAIARGGLEDC